MSDEKAKADEGKSREHEPGQETDLGQFVSRYGMNVVEGADTDRPAEKPKRTIALLLVVLVAVAVIAALISYGGALRDALPFLNRAQISQAKQFTDGLLQNAAFKPHLREAEFVDDNRLRIGIAPGATQEQVTQVLRGVTGAFARFRPGHTLTVYAFRGDRQTASGSYDVRTKQVTVGPPTPLPGESMGGAFRQSAPTGR